MQDFTSQVLSYRYFIEIVTIVAAVLIAISSFDDFFVDVLYWVTRLFGNGHAKENARIGDREYIDSLPEKPFAIMIPAWREAKVIHAMLDSNSRLLRYSAHHYFVGVYQNDPKTEVEVEKAKQKYDNIHTVMVKQDGPTSKAHCLNQIVGAIFQFEAKRKILFSGIVMHDAEDLIHPHELKLLNYLIGKFDFIQLPVFSFTRPIRDFIGGIYMDEFAESHTKDLVVRQRMGAVIPCAGVSACFGRNAIKHLSDINRGETFRTNSFTEDYDISVRVHELGMRTTFVSHPVGYSIDISEETKQPFVIAHQLPIATREFFPSELGAAYRQRARWLIGIIFQGISEIGWRGGLATKYFLTRDRKSLITNPTVIVGYFVLANLILIQLYLSKYAEASEYPFALLNSDYVAKLFLLNLFFLVWRLFHRMLFTARIYGWTQGLMSAPRLITASFVNFFATVRAVRIYFGHRITGKPLVWDKTSHTYPFEIRDESVITEYGAYRQPEGGKRRSGRGPEPRAH
jgi:bacteriophage N4 adsorption protein B